MFMVERFVLFLGLAYKIYGMIGFRASNFKGF